MYDNQILGFDEDAVLSHDTLEYLNLRTNKIDKREEIKKLYRMTALKVLVVTGNPFVERAGESILFELFASIKTLERINKIPVDKRFLKGVFAWQAESYREAKRLEKAEKEAGQEVDSLT